METGGQLRSVGYFRTGPIWAMVLVSDLFVFAIKYYYLGVTDKRLIIVRLNTLGEPTDQSSCAVPLTDVKVKGNALMVKLPDKEKPQKFNMFFGISKLTGFEPREFIASLPAQ